jgi:hypothetical protein
MTGFQFLQRRHNRRPEASCQKSSLKERNNTAVQWFLFKTWVPLQLISSSSFTGQLHGINPWEGTTYGLQYVQIFSGSLHHGGLRKNLALPHTL